METNGWRAPDHNYLELTRNIEMQFSGSGGAIDPMAFYIDPKGASDWCTRVNQAVYFDTFAGLPSHWTSWFTNLVLRHLKSTSFDQKMIDIIGLGVGDGKKETSLCMALLQAHAFERLRCMMLDISPALAEEAHAHFVRCLGVSLNAKGFWGIGNYHNLTRYKDLFYDPKDAGILRVGTMFCIIDNIRHEISFIEQSLRAFKSKDLILIDCCLGYAPPDQPDLIQKKDPSLTFLGDSEFHWFRGIIRRNCPDAKEIDLAFNLKYGLSTIPNAYTIEVTATIDKENQFSLIQKHRYVAEDFIKAFQTRGWQPLGGMHYGPEGKQLLYVFAKR